MSGMGEVDRVEAPWEPSDVLTWMGEASKGMGVDAVNSLCWCWTLSFMV